MLSQTNEKIHHPSFSQQHQSLFTSSIKPSHRSIWTFFNLKNYLMLIFIFAHLVQVSFSMPFTELQTLNVSSSAFRIKALDISDDHEVIVIGSQDDNVYVNLKENGEYVTRQKIEEPSSDIYVSDLSGDGKWLLVVEQQCIGWVYNWNSTSNKFALFQKITLPVDNNSSLAGAFTDDHEWIFIAKFNEIYIYQFDGRNYTLFQKLNQTSQWISSVSVTNDHKYLAYGTDGMNVYVYKFNGTSFQLHQTINEQFSGLFTWRRVSLTDDHQYLTFGGGPDGTVYVYEYNIENDLFQFLQKKNEGEYTALVSMSTDKQFTIVSTLDNLIVYGDVVNKKFVELSKYPLSFSQSHKISKNGQYLVAGQDDGVRIFKFTCQSAQYYDVNQSKCIQCSENCLVCAGSNSCSQCQASYYLQSGSCKFCNASDGFYFEGQNCKFCNKSQGFCLVEGNCSACQSPKPEPQEQKYSQNTLKELRTLLVAVLVLLGIILIILVVILIAAIQNKLKFDEEEKEKENNELGLNSQRKLNGKPKAQQN